MVCKGDFSSDCDCGGDIETGRVERVGDEQRTFDKFSKCEAFVSCSGYFDRRNCDMCFFLLAGITLSRTRVRHLLTTLVVRTRYACCS